MEWGVIISVIFSTFNIKFYKQNYTKKELFSL